MRRPSLITCLFMVTPVVFVAALSARAQAATELELKHMVARVVVTPEDRADIDLKVKNNSKLPKLTVSHKGGKLIVSGGLNRKVKSCGRQINLPMGDGKTYSRRTVEVLGVGNISYDDLPIIYIRTPRDVRLSASSPTFGQIGDSRALKLALSGCGTWTAGAVSGPLELANSGSGDIRITSAGDARISTSGSGDVALGPVGKLDLSNSGSSDFSSGNVSGPASISNSGSGDLSLGAINGNLSIRTSGAGDAVIARVDGNVDISGAGSGDFTIRDGRADRVSLSLAGSGDVHFGGSAGDVDASIAGSGDVSLMRVTGNISKRIVGSGSVRVGN